MSKKASKNRFAYTPTQTLPKLATIKTEWDLKRLYYKNEKDPKIEADLKTAEKAYTAFAKKWSSVDFTKDATTLKRALTEYEKLSGMPAISRPGRYFSFRSALNARDTVAQKQLTLISKRLRKAGEQTLFFVLTLGKLPKQKQQKFLADPKLAHFRYYLERVFRGAKHHLTEAEEKIISLKGSQAYGRWVDMVDQLIANRAVQWKGTEIHIPHALAMLDELKAPKRKQLWAKIITEMKQLGEVAEHEFNAIITDVRTEDELRKYEKPYSGTALGYEDTEESIERLVEAVSTKGFTQSARFYKIKARYHGTKQLHYTEKYEPIGTAPTIEFPQAVEICRDVFYGVQPRYGELFDTMLTGGQIDVFPKKGKRGGAFMSAETGHPTHVFLNHTSTFSSLETLAHEMGHAIHAERSAQNTPFYDGHSITTAETASTLFENLMFDAVYAQASTKQQMTLLHDRITRDISTIERQIAFFNCELEIHNTIHATGGMTNDELATCMQKHLRSYLGPAVSVTKDDGYSYVYVPHLRFGFYVYTYAFGLLMSTLMADRYKEDNGYAAEIDRFLSLGESDTVANIFKAIDIDTTRKETFLDALENQKADIDTFEKLTKQLKK
ncbi:MAG: M3 family metallopeptidase [Candidatus Paceibacterota bacterium]